MKKRFMTKRLDIGGVPVGGGMPIVIQSMTNTKTSNVKATVEQIKNLTKAGCTIVRVAVPDLESAKAIKGIKSAVKTPVIADIHFDPKLALESLRSGVDGLRLNPGNIRDKSKIIEIARQAKGQGVPIRIGVNSGSIDRNRFAPDSPQGLVGSALEHIRLLERMGFRDIKVSLKSTDVLTTIEAYKLMARQRRYPLHIGITEAGTLFSGTVKSSIGIGVLLYEGIGDTIRVSLAADPVQEVQIAKKILRNLGLYREGVEVIACPTCGRTDIDVQAIAENIEAKTMNIRMPLKIAVMGCVVNGPGEARDADIGVTGNRKEGILFKQGRIFKKVPSSRITKALLEEIEKMANEHG